MAFTLKNLENHSGSGAGIKLWSYNTTDNEAAVVGANYFDPAATLLTVGDRIFIHASDWDGTLHVSAISAAGAVTLAAEDALS